MAMDSLAHRLREAGGQPQPGTAKAKPVVNQRIAMERFSADSETGGFVALEASKTNCSGCEFTWGDNTSILAVAHMPDGLLKGDKFALTISMNFDVASTSTILSSVFVGQPFTWRATCELCGGSCRLETLGEEAEFFDVSFPSLYQLPKHCNRKKALKDIILVDRVVKFPACDAAQLQLTGHMNATFDLIRDGESMASNLLKLDFEPTGPAPEGESASPASPDEQGDAVQDAAASLAQLEPSRTATAERKQAMPESVNAIISDLTIYQMENADGDNITFSASGCKKFGEYGGSRCSFPFGEDASVRLSGHLSAEFDKGSYMLLSVVPKATGFVDHMFGKTLEEFSIKELEVPLCTEDLDDNAYGFAIFKHVFGVYLPPCGPVSLNFRLASLDFSLPREIPLPFEDMLAKSPMAMFLSDVNHIPPLSLDVRLQLFHQGAVPMLDAKLKLGLGKI
uniref:Uncharacterized protein n=1 Tax=Alexandrium catenella TaxID=2925 RepID=A0A7S1RB19_ALECA